MPTVTNLLRIFPSVTLTEAGEVLIFEMEQALCRMIFTDATLSITLFPKHKHLSYCWIKRWQELHVLCFWFHKRNGLHNSLEADTYALGGTCGNFSIFVSLVCLSTSGNHTNLHVTYHTCTACPDRWQLHLPMAGHTMHTKAETQNIQPGTHTAKR